MKAAILSGLLLLSLAACDPCKNLDCITSNYSGRFRIVSAANGNDLVFGPAAVYNMNQIKCYSMRGSDTVFFNTKALNVNGAGFDSVLYINFFPESAVGYIRLSNTDTDTLGLSFRRYTSKCCGDITEINNFKFNNLADLGGNGETRVIRK
jgi:hypothetical protein